MDKITAIITVCSMMFVLSIIILSIMKKGRKSALKNKAEYESLQSGDLIKISAPGYLNVAHFDSMSKCKTHFKATVYDYNGEIKERSKVLTRLQFVGKL